MAENALKWVLYAVRPLSPEELLDAISFLPTSVTATARTSTGDGLNLSVICDPHPPPLSRAESVPLSHSPLLQPKIVAFDYHCHGIHIRPCFLE